jgi:AAA15 family ATPase/GTPase
MLKEISLKNFRSFNDEQTFSMEALPTCSLKEHEDHVVDLCGSRLLKLGSVYGPNGSGKSNLMRGLSFFRDLDTFPFYNTMAMHSIDKSFVGNDSKVSSLSFWFIDKDYETKLSFSFSCLNEKPRTNRDRFMHTRGSSSYSIIHEELFFKSREGNSFVRAYSRDGEKVEAPELMKELNVGKFAIPTNVLLLDFISRQFDSPSLFYSAVLSCFKQTRLLQPIEKVSASNLIRLCMSEKMQEQLRVSLNKLLSTKIIGIRLEKGDDGFSLDDLFFMHDFGGEKKELRFYDESEGTRKLASLIASIKLFGHDAIFYADDFDAHLHPVLIKALLEYFGSKMNNSAQLIINSHDILNMNSDNFRRDEIWFTTLQDDNSTRLYALCDLVGSDGRVIRKDKKYSKQYLEGKYGADPFISKGLKL